MLKLCNINFNIGVNARLSALRRAILSTVAAAAVCVAACAADRALLVGVGSYPSSTGWREIHGDADVALLRPLLKKRGFTDITALTNDRATKGAIMKALTELTDRCAEGDRVYIHFSSHGQPVDDANGDEADESGDTEDAELADFADFDQSVVPFDAPCRPSAQYAGQNHLVDDELNPLLDRLKRRVGPKGEIFVAVDACYSRGMERGDSSDITDPDVARFTRGTDVPFVASEHLRNLPVPQGFAQGGAPLVIVSACRKDERNHEYKAPSGQMYGSLSYYIATLLRSGADLSAWPDSFDPALYRPRRIFPSSQHPTVQTYK